LRFKDLEEMGFTVVFYALTALFTATRSIADALAHLKSTGTPANGPAQHTYAEFCGLVDLEFHKGLDDRFGS